ncbi:MAG: hypothetical protein HZR80_18460 [Candidatus Heimdallarchaeota archaeon]
MQLDLWIKTPSSEAHFTAKLTFNDINGKNRIIQDGILKVNEPINNFEKITIDLIATVIEIKKDESLALEVSWSNFPKYSLPLKNDSLRQSIALGRSTPSCIILPFYTKEP